MSIGRWNGVMLTSLLALAALPAALAAQNHAAHAAGGELDAVRAHVSRLADFEAAQAAGYTVRATPCMVQEGGGQGFHYLRPDLMGDGGALDPMNPELLMFERQPDGSMKLVGFEYAIPVPDWTGEDAPTVLGQPLHVNPLFNLWVLHAWTTDNPDGDHADWHPDVRCRSV